MPGKRSAKGKRPDSQFVTVPVVYRMSITLSTFFIHIGDKNFSAPGHGAGRCQIGTVRARPLRPLSRRWYFLAYAPWIPWGDVAGLRSAGRPQDVLRTGPVQFALGGPFVLPLSATAVAPAT